MLNEVGSHSSNATTCAKPPLPPPPPLPSAATGAASAKAPIRITPAFKRIVLPPLSLLLKRPLRNFAQASSPLPEKERIEGEGPYTARSFARDFRFYFFSEQAPGLCKNLY